MKRISIYLLLLFTAAWGSGCIGYGAVNPFCTKEESIHAENLLFKQGPMKWGDNDYLVMHSSWKKPEKEFFYVIRNVKEKSEQKYSVRYFLYDGFYWADIRFDTAEEPFRGKHDLCLVGPLGKKFVFLPYYPIYDDKKYKGNDIRIVSHKDSKFMELTGDTKQLRKLITTLPFKPWLGLTLTVPLAETSSEEGICGKAYREKFLDFFMTVTETQLDKDSERIMKLWENALLPDETAELPPETVKKTMKRYEALQKKMKELQKGGRLER